MRGGRTTPAQAGHDLAHRDIIYGRIQAIPEGHFFRAEDVAHTPEEMADLTLMRDHDYIHICHGNLVGIIETPHLRRLPRIDTVLASYMQTYDCHLTETGDRTAWRHQINQWEPIEGYRYHSTGITEVISFGYCKIRMIATPAPLLQDSPAAILFRCFYDQPIRDQMQALRRAPAVPNLTRDDLLAAAHFGLSLPDDLAPQGAEPPSLTARRIIDHLVTLERR